MPSLKEIKDILIKYVRFCMTVPKRRRRGTASVIPSNVAVPGAVPLAVPVAVPFAVPVAVPLAVPGAPVAAPVTAGNVRRPAPFRAGPGGDCIDPEFDWEIDVKPRERIPRRLRHLSEDQRAAYPEKLRYFRRLISEMEANLILQSVCHHYNDKGESYGVALFANH